MHLKKLPFTVILFFLSLHALTAQTFMDKTLEHDGETRAYKLYVPDSYQGTEAVPLLFNFHGAAMSAELQILWISDMRSIADTAGFILVYPEGLPDAEGDQVWNIEGPSSNLTTDDIGFTEAMIDALADEYMIDQNRVYACGYSNGGFFAFDLACRLSHRIAAVGSVAGTMLADTYNDCSPSHPTAVISIHGTDDFIVAYDGFPPFSWSLDEVNDYWVDFNNAATPPTVVTMPDLNTADGSTVEYSDWNNGDGCTSVAHYKVIGGGHDWPDVDGDPTKTNVDISADDLIWNFVSQYDLEGLIGCNATPARETISDRKAIRLSPNPATDFTTIQMEWPYPVEYQIYSTMGKRLLSGLIDSGGTTIQLSGLPPNVYLVKVGQQTVKLLKTE